MKRVLLVSIKQYGCCLIDDFAMHCSLSDCGQPGHTMIVTITRCVVCHTARYCRAVITHAAL